MASMPLNDSTQAKKKGSLAVYPAVGYAPETKIQLGAIMMYVVGRDTATGFNRPNSYIPYFLYTGNKQLLSSFETEFYYPGGTYWNNEVRFHDYPDFFYGTGTGTKKSDEEIFSNRFFRNRGKFLWIREARFFYGLAYDVRYDYLGDFEEQGVLIQGTPTGVEGGWNNGFGPTATFDTRNDVYYPSAGSMVSVTSMLYAKAMGSTYSYANFTVDARHFLKVFSDRNLLAMQGYFNATAGREVPFYRLPQLGGDSRLRGIANENLYRDKVSWYVQAEGRQHLFWRFGGVLFVGAGNVAPTLGQMPFNTTKAVAGFGGRFQAVKDQKLNIRFDVGFASDGHHAIYVSLGEAF